MVAPCVIHCICKKEVMLHKVPNEDLFILYFEFES
jgi:hypothetical protein